MTILEDFIASIPSRDQDACWPWPGYLTNDGYGRYRYQSRTWGPHRLVFELLVGPIPDGLQIDHLCRNRACCNPAHLEPVTQRENAYRSPIAFGGVNRLKQVCSNGHPFDEANTYVHYAPGKTGRNCRACNREAQRRRKARLQLRTSGVAS